MGLSKKNNHFYPQNDKFGCIFTQVSTGRKQSLEALDTDLTVLQSRNEAHKNSAKFKLSRSDQGGGRTIAPPP